MSFLKTALAHVRTPLMLAVAIVSAACLFLNACGATSGDRKLMWQSREGGRMLAEDGNMPPSARTIGGDIQRNQETLMEDLGAPDATEKQPYTPSNSDAARQQAKKEHTEPPAIVQTASNWLNTVIPGAGLLLTTAWGIGMTIARRGTVQKLADAGDRLLATYDGVDTLKTEIADKLKGVGSIEELKKAVSDGTVGTWVTDIMREVAGLHTVYNDVKAELSAFRASGDLKPQPAASTAKPS